MTDVPATPDVPVPPQASGAEQALALLATLQQDAGGSGGPSSGPGAAAGGGASPDPEGDYTGADLLDDTDGLVMLVHGLLLFRAGGRGAAEGLSPAERRSLSPWAPAVARRVGPLLRRLDIVALVMYGVSLALIVAGRWRAVSALAPVRDVKAEVRKDDRPMDGTAALREQPGQAPR